MTTTCERCGRTFRLSEDCRSCPHCANKSDADVARELRDREWSIELRGETKREQTPQPA